MKSCDSITIQLNQIMVNVMLSTSNLLICDGSLGKDVFTCLIGDYVHLTHDGNVPTNQRLPFPSIISHKVSYLRVQMLKHRYKRYKVTEVTEWNAVAFVLHTLHTNINKLREIDSVAQVMLNTADVQCYYDGRCNNGQ